MFSILVLHKNIENAYRKVKAMVRIIKEIIYVYKEGFFLNVQNRGMWSRFDIFLLSSNN